MNQRFGSPIRPLKETHTLFGVFGAMGIGKTRFMLEFPRRIMRFPLESKHSQLATFVAQRPREITLAVNMLTDPYDMETDGSPARGVALRMLRNYFSDKQFDSSFISRLSEHFSIVDAMRVILLSVDHEQQVLFTLCIDDVQRVVERWEHAGRNHGNLNHPLSSLASACGAVLEQFAGFRYLICIFVAGTLVRHTSSLMSDSSGWTTCSVQLPLLSMSEMLEYVIPSLPIQSCSSVDWPRYPALLSALAYIGGHARSLRYFASFVDHLHDPSTFDEAIVAMVHKMNDHVTHLYAHSLHGYSLRAICGAVRCAMYHSTSLSASAVTLTSAVAPLSIRQGSIQLPACLVSLLWDTAYLHSGADFKPSSLPVPSDADSLHPYNANRLLTALFHFDLVSWSRFESIVARYAAYLRCFMPAPMLSQQPTTSTATTMMTLGNVLFPLVRMPAEHPCLCRSSLFQLVIRYPPQQFDSRMDLIQQLDRRFPTTRDIVPDTALVFNNVAMAPCGDVLLPLELDCEHLPTAVHLDRQQAAHFHWPKRGRPSKAFVLVVFECKYTKQERGGPTVLNFDLVLEEWNKKKCALTEALKRQRRSKEHAGLLQHPFILVMILVSNRNVVPWERAQELPAGVVVVAEEPTTRGSIFGEYLPLTRFFPYPLLFAVRAATRYVKYRC